MKPNGVEVPDAGRQRWLPWAAGLLTILMLAGAILFTRAALRRELRAQLASRDAQVLRALLQRQLAGAMGRADSDPLLAVLDASTLPELPGIVGVRLFDEDGAFFTGLLAATGSEPLGPEALGEAHEVLDGVLDAALAQFARPERRDRRLQARRRHAQRVVAVAACMQDLHAHLAAFVVHCLRHLAMARDFPRQRQLRRERGEPAAQAGRDDAMRLGEGGDLPAPVAVVAQRAMDQQDRRTRSRARLGVVQVAVGAGQDVVRRFDARGWHYSNFRRLLAVSAEALPG